MLKIIFLLILFNFQYVFCDSRVGKICTPCHGKLTHKLSDKQEIDLGKTVPSWKNNGRRNIARSFSCAERKRLMLFIDLVARLAEKEGHHPDFSYKNGKLTCILYTHAFNALSENDFILANKIDIVWAALNTKDNSYSNDDDDHDEDGGEDDEGDYEDKLIKRKRTRTKKSSKLRSSWMFQKALSGRLFSKYNLDSFMSTVAKFKEIIELIDDKFKCDYDLYAFYNQIRVDLKRSFDARGSITEKTLVCALAIQDLF